MRRTRQVLAVMLVATALCADRGAAALSSDPPRAQSEPARTSLAARIIRGLSRTLGQSADVMLARQDVRPGRPLVRGPAAMADQSPGRPNLPISPFQFRLPPPAA